MLAHEIADAAAEREPADPDGGCVAEAGGETVRRGGDRDLARGEAARRMRDAAGGVDLESGEAGQVEHDPSLARAVAGRTVAAASDGELEAGLPRKRDDAGDLAGVGGPHDRRRPAVDRRQEDAPRRVVAWVAGADNGPSELGAELPDREPGLLCCVHERLLRRGCFRLPRRCRRRTARPVRHSGFQGCG